MSEPVQPTEQNDSPQDLAISLETARRSLAILEKQAAGYTSLTIPSHLQIELEDKRREVAELESLVTQAPDSIASELPQKSQSSSLKKTRPSPSGKKVEPVIVVALIGLVGTLLTAILASPVIVSLIEKSQSLPTSTTQLSTPLLVTTPQMLTFATESPNATCMDEYLRDIALERQIYLEIGVTQEDLYIPAEDRTGKTPIGPLAAIFTSQGVPFAATRFLILHEDDNFSSFSVVSIVDVDCQEITGYKNVIHPSSPSTLQNWDVLEIPIADQKYPLRMGWQGDHIRFSFRELE